MVSLSDVIDRDTPHTDVIVEKKVEQNEKTIQFFIRGCGREGGVHHLGPIRDAFDVFGHAIEDESSRE